MIPRCGSQPVLLKIVVGPELSQMVVVRIRVAGGGRLRLVRLYKSADAVHDEARRRKCVSVCRILTYNSRLSHKPLNLLSPIHLLLPFSSSFPYHLASPHLHHHVPNQGAGGDQHYYFHDSETSKSRRGDSSPIMSCYLEYTTRSTRVLKLDQFLEIFSKNAKEALENEPGVLIFELRKGTKDPHGGGPVTSVVREK
jgi:hypothetical protein